MQVYHSELLFTFLFLSYKCSPLIIAVLQSEQRFSVYFYNAQLHLEQMLSAH